MRQDGAKRGGRGEAALALAEVAGWTGSAPGVERNWVGWELSVHRARMKTEAGAKGASRRAGTSKGPVSVSGGSAQ